MQILLRWLLPTFLILNTSGLVHGLASHNDMGFKRQAEEASPASTTSTPRRTASASNTEETTSSAQITRSSSNRSSQSGTATSRKGTFVDPRLPPGGVVIQTPITTSGSLYYKIGEPITFGWNYTSLLISPTAVNIEAFCSDNSQTYTIAHNVSIGKPSVVWDTGSYIPNNDQPPLAMGIYTLHIYDEKAAITAAPTAGYLSPFDGLKFGMYTPKPYTPLAEFECATCEKSGAASLDIIAIRMLIITTSLISISFAFFITAIA